MACITPYLVKDQNKEYIPVPCGKCPPCLKRRASAWSFRLLQELKRSTSAWFITLTYDTTYVPYTKSGKQTLEKTALQCFFKRLRKKNPLTKIKYYACGEYGSIDERPHYHVILFNADIETISPSWGLGYVHYGDVTPASIGYTLKYMQKPSIVQEDDRQKEFQLQSLKLGDNYLTPSVIRWHKADIIGRVYLPLEGGKKAAMPRYYKDRLYNHNDRSRIAQWGYHLAIQRSEELQARIRRIYKRTSINVDKVITDEYIREFKKMHADARARNNIVKKDVKDCIQLHANGKTRARRNQSAAFVDCA